MKNYNPYGTIILAAIGTITAIGLVSYAAYTHAQPDDGNHDRGNQEPRRDGSSGDDSSNNQRTNVSHESQSQQLPNTLSSTSNDVGQPELLMSSSHQERNDDQHYSHATYSQEIRDQGHQEKVDMLYSYGEEQKVQPTVENVNKSHPLKVGPKFEKIDHGSNQANLSAPNKSTKFEAQEHNHESSLGISSDLSDKLLSFTPKYVLQKHVHPSLQDQRNGLFSFTPQRMLQRHVYPDFQDMDNTEEHKESLDLEKSSYEKSSSDGFGNFRKGDLTDQFKMFSKQHVTHNNYDNNKQREENSFTEENENTDTDYEKYEQSYNSGDSQQQEAKSSQCKEKGSGDNDSTKINEESELQKYDNIRYGSYKDSDTLIYNDVDLDIVGHSDDSDDDNHDTSDFMMYREKIEEEVLQGLVQYDEESAKEDEQERLENNKNEAGYKKDSAHGNVEFITIVNNKLSENHKEQYENKINVLLDCQNTIANTVHALYHLIAFNDFPSSSNTSGFIKFITPNDDILSSDMQNTIDTANFHTVQHQAYEISHLQDIVM